VTDEPDQTGGWTDGEPAAWGAFEGFVGGRLGPPDDILDGVLEASAAAGLPPVNVSANQGSLLALLVRVSGAHRVLELGTLGGYSTVWMARALPTGGRLVTVDADGGHVAVARANLARAGLQDVVDCRTGPAEELVAQLGAEGGPPFDLVFVDVDESVNAGLFAPVRRLTRPGGLVIVGAADLVRGTRRLVAALAAEPDVTATAVQSVGAGGLGGLVIARIGDGRG